MASPNITLTCNFESPAGASTGSAVIELQGYAANDTPRVSSTGVIATIQYTTTPGASFSQVVWGNDQITPAGTTYLIKYYDANGNFAVSKTYTFSGGPKTVDLSTQ